MRHTGLTPQHSVLSGRQVGFEDNRKQDKHLLVEVVEPEWGTICLALGEIDEADVAEEVRALCGRFAVGLVRVLISNRRDGRAMGTNVISLAYAMGLVDGDSLAALAAPLGVSKQAIGKLSSRWRDVLGAVSASMKSEAARAVYAERAKAVHKRRKDGLPG